MNVIWLNKATPLCYKTTTLHQLNKDLLTCKVKSTASKPKLQYLQNSTSSSSVQNQLFLNNVQFTLRIQKRTFSSDSSSIPPSSASIPNDTKQPSLAEELVRTVDDPLYDTTQVPSFQPYFRTLQQERPIASNSANRIEKDPRLFTYVMVGAAGMLTSMAAKNSIINLLTVLAPTSRVIAAGKIEVDLSKIPEAKNMIVKWRGKPVFIRHRTDAEVQEAADVDWRTLRDPQPDTDRAQNPKWLIMVGICTHLGCVPVGEAGDYGGWYCPCHGSHYDISGRIRQGPAPTNLEIPPYQFIESLKVAIG